MNKKRKHRIEEIYCELTQLLNEEELYMESIPENLSSSKNYENSEAAQEDLQTAIDALENIIHQ